MIRPVRHDSSGFTLIEILLVVTVAALVMAMAIPSVGTALLDARANSGMRQMLGQLRAARDAAMTQRRTIEVQFIGQTRIQTIRIDGAVRTPLASTVLENGMQYRLFAGVPDTPDLFGNGRAVDFGGLTTVWFLADGSLTDADGVPLSGTVFIGMTDRPLSARAVTVLGPTGRVQNYRWDSRAWR